VPCDHHLLTSHGNSIADDLVQAHLNALVHIVRIAVRWRVLLCQTVTPTSRESDARFATRQKRWRWQSVACRALYFLFARRMQSLWIRGDYVAAPPGTNVLVQYVRYGRDDGINIEGAGDLTAHLDSEIEIFRAIHFASLFGLTGDPQIIIPFGSLKNWRPTAEQQLRARRPDCRGIMVDQST
jgi:hypothetical protein